MVYLTVAGLAIPFEADGEAPRLNPPGAHLGPEAGGIRPVKILSQAPDIASQEQFYQVLTLVVAVPAGYKNPRSFPVYAPAAPAPRPRAVLQERPIVIGFGPAGMFAALELIERGLKPLIFERGKKIEERSADVERFIASRALDTESNIQFGEGGAGAYSDGKLFSRVNNSARGNKVLDTFVRFGARPDIAWLAKPHVGTDVLCTVVRNVRNYILEQGGEIRYGAKMTDLLLTGGKARGVAINGRQEYASSNI